MGCFTADDEDSDTVDRTVEKRGCTDVFWLFVFIAFCMALITVACFAQVYGNPKRLMNGYDKFGNTCGAMNDVLDPTLEFSGRDLRSKPYLFFMNVQNLSHALQICVEECPKRFLNTPQDIETYYQETGTNLCNYDYNFKTAVLNLSNLDGVYSAQGPCPRLPVYESTPVLNRCIPTLASSLNRQVVSHFYGKLNSLGILNEMTADLYESWYSILLLILLALFLSLLMIFVIHYFAAFVSSIVIIVVIVSTVGTTAFLWLTYFDAKASVEKQDRSFILAETYRNKTALFWISVLASIITGIILTAIFFMRKQVSFLADLFRETTKCLKAIPCLFIQPFVTFLILILFLVFWMYVVTCLATAHHPVQRDINSLPSLSSFPAQHGNLLNSNEKPINVSFVQNVKKIRTVEFIDFKLVPYMWGIIFFAILWMPEFLLSCQQMIISGAVAHWFYREKFKNEQWHVSYSVCKLFKYHVGSVAKGSFLITLFRIPRMILTYLYNKSKQAPETNVSGITYCLRCCMCFFYCWEKFIRYLTHNAYTVVAIDGTNFCSSARTAFNILASHSIEVATINSLGDFILFLCKCLITAITTSAALFMFREDGQFKFFAAPTLVVAAFSYFIAHCIMSIYEMVLDTVYLCMCQNGEVPGNIQLQSVAAKRLDTNEEATPMTKH